MAAWRERQSRVPLVAFVLYVSLVLGLLAWILYRVALPLPSVIP